MLKNVLNILILFCFKGICLACGDIKVCAEHPLFKGGLCKECKVSTNQHFGTLMVSLTTTTGISQVQILCRGVDVNYIFFVL